MNKNLFFVMGCMILSAGSVCVAGEMGSVTTGAPSVYSFSKFEPETIFTATDDATVNEGKLKKLDLSGKSITVYYILNNDTKNISGKNASVDKDTGDVTIGGTTISADDITRIDDTSNRYGRRRP